MWQNVEYSSALDPDEIFDLALAATKSEHIATEARSARAMAIMRLEAEHAEKARPH